MALLSALAAIAGLIITLIIFAYQVRDQIRLRRAEFIIRLEDKYDQLCAARVQNPCMMRCRKECEKKHDDRIKPTINHSRRPCLSEG